MSPDANLSERIRAYYTARLQDGACCGSQASAPLPPVDAADLGGAVPDGASLDAARLDAVPSFGCGQPTHFAELAPGQSVLDLGSGAGLDAFRAVQAVGPSGRVIGVDMTPAMLVRARRGAQALGLDNVTFREGFIEALPVEDESVDVVLSNCVINLSQDKAAVFREAFRVLRPGGRLAVSDVLRRGPRRVAASEAGWCACVDGAEPAEAYRALLREAGFADIVIDPPPGGLVDGATYSASVRAVRPSVRAAHDDDLAAVADLLTEAKLPTEGIDDGATRLYLIEEGAPLAVVGFELRGRYALLRSLAVREGARSRGYGEALVRHVLREAGRLGAIDAYGLTTTIPELLVRWGFEEMQREALPAELQASAELRGACPASARTFRRTLGRELPRG